MAMKFPGPKAIWISENKARHICQEISLQDLDDIVIRDMGIVCHPLDPNNNISIDVYSLKFINTNRSGVETKTFFPVLKARVHELK